MIRRLLFGTRAGELLLAALERWIGLAIVDSVWLADQLAGDLQQNERGPAFAR